MKLKKMMGLALAGVLLFTSACGSTGGQSADGSSDKQKKIEYDILISYSTSATTLDNPNDVVTPYVEAKFNIEVGEITRKYIRFCTSINKTGRPLSDECGRP